MSNFDISPAEVKTSFLINAFKDCVGAMEYCASIESSKDLSGSGDFRNRIRDMIDNMDTIQTIRETEIDAIENIIAI